MIKECNKCNIPKPLSPQYYRRSNTNRHGFQGICKECTNKQSREHYQKKKYTNLANPDNNNIDTMSDKERYDTFQKEYEKLCNRYEVSHEVLDAWESGNWDIYLRDERIGKIVFI